MAFLFSGLYEAIPDIDLYLKRIDYHGDRAPTPNNLKTLIHQHLTHIPYGNLDFFLDQKCPSLAISDIFEKIVVRYGCGGCFEINLLFFALLKSLGYELFPVIVKCLLGSDDPVVPTHCAAIVTIDDARYYVDVGLGNSSPVVPVVIDEGLHWQPETISPNYYAFKMRRQGNTILFEGNKGNKQMSMVSFVPEPVEAVDFIPLNYYACLAETSPVRRGVIVSIFRQDGTAQIVDDRLSIRSGNTFFIKKLKTSDDFNHVLWDVFGIRYKISAFHKIRSSLKNN